MISDEDVTIVCPRCADIERANRMLRNDVAQLTQRAEQAERERDYWKQEFQSYVGAADKIGVVFSVTRDDVIAEHPEDEKFKREHDEAFARAEKSERNSLCDVCCGKPLANEREVSAEAPDWHVMRQ